jgi:hypothetical protein
MIKFLLSYVLIINFSSVYGATLLPNGVNKTKCVSFSDIEKAAVQVKELSKWGTVTYASSSLKNLIKENCSLFTSQERTDALKKLDENLLPYIKQGDKVNFKHIIRKLQSDSSQTECSLEIDPINTALQLNQKYNFSFPREISIDILTERLNGEVRKFENGLDQCFSKYIYHLNCSNEIYRLPSIINNKSRFSIENSINEFLVTLKKDCSSNDFERRMVAAIEEYVKGPVEDSLYTEYYRLKEKLRIIAGREDPTSVLNSLEALAERLNLSEEFMRYKIAIVPPIKEVDDYSKMRSLTCRNIDNTNRFIRTDKDQGGTGACFAFAGANLLNFHLGIENMSALYLFTLAIAQKDVFWYHIEDFLNSSNSELSGGFTSGAINQALKRNTYCSTTDIFDAKVGAPDLRLVIVATEEIGNKSLEIKHKLEQGEIDQTKYKKLLHKLFTNVSSIFKKSSYREFELAVQSSANGKTFFQNFLLSQCKTKMPGGKEKIKVEAAYRFTEQSNISLEELDNVIENYGVSAIGFQASMLLGGKVVEEWGPHITTITARRWNPSRGRCEYKIVNSWGGACSSVLNPEVLCEENQSSNIKELWISESYLQHYSNSLTSITNSPTLEILNHSNPDYSPDDIE